LGWAHRQGKCCNSRGW
jgi:hypothetical protein